MNQLAKEIPIDDAAQTAAAKDDARGDAAKRDRRPVAWNELTLSGWGRNAKAAMPAARPERISELADALDAAGDGTLVARGAGRSYGDSAISEGGRALLTNRLDRILDFDEATGDIVVEPGLTFRDLLDVFLPRGFITPVSPGTAFATIGGAVANDVHGKNHDAVGSFGDHVRWIDLMLPSGEVARASPTERKALFHATIAGIGLTGVIRAVCFRMMRVGSNAVDHKRTRIPNLDAFLEAFDDAPSGDMVYSVGWIDGLARGGALGRGIFEVATPAAEDVPARPRRSRTVPFDLPSIILNPLSIRAFNSWYYSRVPDGGQASTPAYDEFLYPLDSLLEWNRIYGKRGFHQFQCVLPRKGGPSGLRSLLEAISSARRGSFLAVLKTLGGEGPGMLSFPMEGYTLAMDFPNKRGVADLLARLERITLDHGGRIYLAKDSALSADGFAAMYPRLDEFREVLAEVDPDGRMTSDMARRLGIRRDSR